MRVLDRKNIITALCTGGGGSEEITLTGESPLVLTNVASGSLKSLKLKGGAITQEGTPTPDDPKPILIGGRELKISADGVPYVEGSELVVARKIDIDITSGRFVVDEGNDIDQTPIANPTRCCSNVIFIDSPAKIETFGDSVITAICVAQSGDVITWRNLARQKSADLVLPGKYRFQFGKDDNSDMSAADVKCMITQCESSIPLPLLIGTDEADITSGEVTRRYGVYVCDGSEEILNQAESQGRYTINITKEAVIPYGPISSRLIEGYSNVGIATNATQSTANGEFFLYKYDEGSMAIILYTTAFDASFNFKAHLKRMYDVGTPYIFVYPSNSAQKPNIPPTSVPLIKPTSVLTTYASGIEATYKAKQKPTPWYEYVVGLNTSVDYSAKTDLTGEGLANIILKSAPTHAIVIKLSSADYAKCASGGMWYNMIAPALASKPLVSIAQ